jgi:hypothetical protein
MNGGWFDILRMCLGWKSAPRIGVPPYRAIAGEVWHPGAAAGGAWTATAIAAAVQTSGSERGQIRP